MKVYIRSPLTLLSHTKSIAEEFILTYKLYFIRLFKTRYLNRVLNLSVINFPKFLFLERKKQFVLNKFYFDSMFTTDS